MSLTTQQREQFLREAHAAAVEANLRGAPINAIVAAAQTALESNWGTSQLAQLANNLGGIKAGRSWDGPIIELPTREWRSSDNTWYTTTAEWRVYEDWEDYFEDYGELIRRVYPHAAAKAAYPTEFLEQLTALDYPKYATDPAYFNKVWSIVQQYSMLTWVSDETDPELLIVFNEHNEEALRLTIPKGGSVLTRHRGDRTYVRVEAPEQ